MRKHLLLVIGYFPLVAVLAFIAVQLLPTEAEGVMKRSVLYMPIVVFASVASTGVLVWALFHLYGQNDEVDTSERLRWTAALLFVSIFSVPQYIKRFVLHSYPT